MTFPVVLPSVSPPTAPVPARPALHFTAPAHWLNDPHGICWAGGEYHLFYQHNPRGTTWSARISWGHATSGDLVRWRHQPIALTPEPGERGCWSGAVLVADDRPTILYTSVTGDDWDIGRVAAARPDDALRQWVSARSPEVDVVVEAPPAELEATVFRDPCLVHTDDGWAMVVGVGVADGTGLAVQWVSPDGASWTYDGVVCARPTDAEGLWTGTMWECPQLFRVQGGTWALVVAAWQDGRLYYNAAAVGSYDGHRFVAERWSRLTHDENAYAMTSFTDRAGRPAVMFWLREDADHDPLSRSWAGALSLPMVVELTAGRELRLVPHPDVDTLLTGDDVPAVGTWALDGSGLDLRLPAGTVAITADGEAVVGLTVSAGAVTVFRPGRPDTTVPVVDPSVRIVVDAGIVMIHGGTGCGTVRFDAAGAVEVDLDAPGGTVQRLAPAF